jgi:TatD DNase family protein
MIIDSHAHLDMPQFDADRADVIGRAGDNGLDLIITVGTGNPSESSVERTLDLVEKYPLLSAAIGVHPHDARLADDAYWEKMESWAFNPKVVIWGEIGLDYYTTYLRGRRKERFFAGNCRWRAGCGFPFPFTAGMHGMK